MRVGLFVPCYVDQLYPDVALAALEVLESVGCTVVYPEAQTCCGQPMANTGCFEDALPLARRFIATFSGFDYVVAPSGSCVAMVRAHYAELLHDDAGYRALAPRVLDLCEFLVDVVGVEKLPKRTFNYRVGLHQSCHGLRELRLGKSSERMLPDFNKTRRVLEQLDGVEFTGLLRPDECCGFGGTFAVAEEAISCAMGNDRIADHEHAKTQVLTAGDMSCLMHLDGLIRRQGKPISVLHVAQILAGRKPSHALPVLASANGAAL
ncbi:MAG: (Fe-S)-binding protein [Polyangiaceae bacterium]|nr:(Fe-S)-binding protein [Polyangiaceae bacterium]